MKINIDEYCRHCQSASPALLILVLCTLLIVGCAQAPMKQFEPDASTLAEAQQINKQLTLSAYPVLNMKVNLDYFGVDLPGKGLIPVYIRIHNGADANHYVVDPEKCRLSGQQSSSSRVTSRVTEMDKSAEEFVDTAAILLFTPAILGGLANATNIAETKERIEKGALRKTIIRPGDVIEGFVYFQAKAEELEKNDGVLQVAMLELDSSKWENFEFLLGTRGAK